MSKACVRVAALLSFVSIGCGASQGGGADGNDPFGTGAKNGSSGGNSGINAGGNGYFPDQLVTGKGGKSGSGSGTGDDKFCNQQNFELNRLPPEILLVLDRSGSMRRDARGETGTPDKWEQTTKAIDATLANTQLGVHWGLKMYPAWKKEGDSACATTPIAGVDPGVSQHGAIMSTIGTSTPTRDKGATPTAKAVEEATTLMKARTSMNPKFLLLATDGIPNCRGNVDTNKDVDGAVAAVAAANAAGFATFVVGIAASGIMVDGVDAFAVLNNMAQAGGRARDGDTKFYSANNQAELTTALGSIAQQAADCTFVLTEPPGSPGDVAVELDGARLGTNDWSYGAGNRSIVIQGAYCDKLKKGDVKEAQVKFGCPGQVIL